MAENEEKLTANGDIPEDAAQDNDAENIGVINETEEIPSESTDGDNSDDVNVTDDEEQTNEDEVLVESEQTEAEDEPVDDGQNDADAPAESKAARRRWFAAKDRVKGANRKKSKVPVIILIIIAVLIAAIGISAIVDSNRLEKSFYQVVSTKVTDNIRVVCLSDMHLKEFGKDNETLIHEVEKLGPDIIALVGDMNLESKPDEYGVVTNLCLKLNEIAPVYYSLGNHELDAMLFGKSNIYKDIKKAGIKILNNEMETVTIGATTLDIIGLSQGPAQFEKYGKSFFDKAMNKTDNFKLVLNHFPEQFLGTFNDEYDIDLMLAGHAHGGQVRLPWIGGLYSADQGLFPKLCDGYHEIENSRLIISRGLGKSGLVPRIFNKPEIMIVDIGWY